MTKDIELLVKVQAIDLCIKELNEKRDEIPLRLDEAETKLSKARLDKEEADKKLTDKKLERKDFELELETIEAALKKHNTELNAIKSNDAYKALLKELEADKKKKDEMEDKILEDFDDLDEIEGLVKNKADLVKIAGEELEAKKEELDKESCRINQEIEKHEKERKNIVVNISNVELLDKYEKIKKHKHGMGLAKLDVEKKSCAGCNMSLPPQVVSDVMESSEIVICENCSKILYTDNKG